MVKTLPSNAGDASSIPGEGDKIPHASGPEKKNKTKQNINQKQYCNKFNKDKKWSTSKQDLFSHNSGSKMSKINVMGKVLLRPIFLAYR